MPSRLAVLSSGKCTLLSTMIEQEVPIELVATDRACEAEEIARQARIPFVFLPRALDRSFNREKYTQKMITVLRSHKIDLVALAGFKTVFAPSMFERDAYQLKMLNTHPSLLPAFKGNNAVADTIRYGAKVSGCTIHFVIDEVDAGPILLQESVLVHSSDTVESLHERIKEVERKVYPGLIRELISGDA